MTQPFQVIIGLEVHVQLATQGKLFSRVSTTFGQPPNTQTSPICIGMPGTLPVLNRHAFELALKTSVALNCKIPAVTKWDRKHYYYPDLPKGYQISQFDQPVGGPGYLHISDPKGSFEPKDVGITRAHLEEDAGKSMHDEVHGRADSKIDLNRTGTPLLEIVSEPDMRSPEEARAYLNELKLLLTYLQVSDCNMQEGSLRVDANINLHVEKDGKTVATPIVEIKNMNSFRAVERALAFEVTRQWNQFQETGVEKGKPGGHKTTRGWDDSAEVTRPQREKEESSDYRYFPDPDLVPIQIQPELVEQIRGELGELPADIRTRLEKEYALDSVSSDIIVNQGAALVAYFETLAKESGDAKRASNWIQQDILRTLNEQQIGIEAFPVSASRLAELLKALAAGDLDSSRGKDVFVQMLEHDQSAAAAMETLGIEKVDNSAVETLCRELLEKNPQVVAEVKDGKQKGIGMIIGQAKKANPNVNPNDVRRICLELIASM